MGLASTNMEWGAYARFEDDFYITQLSNDICQYLGFFGGFEILCGSERISDLENIKEWLQYNIKNYKFEPYVFHTYRVWLFDDVDVLAFKLMWV